MVSRALFWARALLHPIAYSASDALEHGLLEPHADARIAWTLKPNLDTRFKGLPFSTNEAGFRTPAFNPIKKQDVIRIAVVGRSITMGSGVADHEVYTARLQEMLNKTSPGRYEVINFAVSGHELPQMSAVYERFVAALNPI